MLDRFNKFIEKWMAFVTPLCLLVGVCFPEFDHDHAYASYSDPGSGLRDGTSAVSE